MTKWRSGNNDEVYFGFTEDEIISILDVYNMQDRLSAVKDWYDGYLFGDREVYNPWSAFQFIDDAKNKHDYQSISYLANTSGNYCYRYAILS